MATVVGASPSSPLAKHVSTAKLLSDGKKLHNMLTVIRRRLQETKLEGAFSQEDVMTYKHMLDDLDAKWRDDSGHFAGELAEADPQAGEEVAKEWTECYGLAEGMLHAAQDMPPDVRRVCGRLLTLKHRMVSLKAAEHTMLDVLPLEKELDAVVVDRLAIMRGRLGDPAAKEVACKACDALLEECHGLVEFCVRSAQEDVPPEMQLLCRKLRELKHEMRKLHDKAHTMEQLAYYAQQLAGIEEQRRDGVFCGDLQAGRLPAGQSTAAHLMTDCYVLLEELTGTSSELPEEVVRVKRELSKYLKALESMRRRPYTGGEVQQVQDAVEGIDAERQRHGGIFGGDLGSGKIPEGQSVCASLLSHCHRLIQQLRQDISRPSLAPGTPGTAHASQEFKEADAMK